jgi:hypothetical protein
MPGCSSPAKLKKKNTVISNVLRDLSFSGNQTLKLADDLYVGILKIK